MLKTALYFLFIFSFLLGKSRSDFSPGGSLSVVRPCFEEKIVTAIHGVVTRTIVIDYSPFPDLAISVDNAIIKEGETVKLEADISKMPCAASNSIDRTRSAIAAPAVKIISEKEVICEGESATLTAVGANSYTWNTGEKTNRIHVRPALTSSFFVVGENKEGCKSISYYLQRVEGCNLDLSANTDMLVFPNPSEGRFFLEVHAQGKELTLFVYNNIGRLVSQQQIAREEFEIDLSDQPDGMYLLRLIADGKEIQRKHISKKL